VSLPFLRAIPEGVRLEVLVQPRASRSRIVGEHYGRLKIQLAAPPVDGEANKELVKMLAHTFKVSKSSVKILKGNHGRRKTLELFGVDPAAVADKL